MRDLSEQQKAAVQYVKGPLLVLAGAGGGKTSLLVHKIAWLIREYSVDPAAIVTLAANATTSRCIRTRIEELLGRKIPALTVATFGEFGLQLLQQHATVVGLRPGFTLYDRLESETLIARMLRQTETPATVTASAVWRHIAEWKRAATPPPAANAVPGSCPVGVAAWVYEGYEQRLRTANAIDLEDLARKAIELLTTDATLVSEWRNRTGFLLVDEYEQTSVCEHELVRLLTASGVVLTAAGDDTAAMLAGRGDRTDTLARLQSDFADLRVVKIEQNFRCTARILKAATRLAAPRHRTPDASLRHATRLGMPLRVLQTRSEQHEAEGIAMMLADHQSRHGTDFRHYAILFRQAEQAPPLEHALQAHRVPYHARGGLRFFDRTEVRDLWAYLKLLCNPCDDNAFLRAINSPRRDIDHAALQHLMRFAAEHGRSLFESTLAPELARALAPDTRKALQEITMLLRALIARAERNDPVQLVCDLVADLRYADWLHDTCNDAKIAERRMENVTHLIGMLRRLARQHPEVGLRELLAQLNLRAVLDDETEDATDGVALMPLSAARGLEFSHVYLIGFEEDSITPDGATDFMDERYWAYLGVTRARESVTFAITEHRRAYGGVRARQPARFLTDLSPQDLEWVNTEPGGPLAESTLRDPRPQFGDISRYSR